MFEYLVQGMDSEIRALIKAARGHQEAVFSLELWNGKSDALFASTM